jgi:hypothetical protein
MSVNITKAGGLSNPSFPGSFLFRSFQIFLIREYRTDSLLENRKVNPDGFKHCFVIHTEIVVHDLIPHSRDRLPGEIRELLSQLRDIFFAASPIMVSILSYRCPRVILRSVADVILERNFHRAQLHQVCDEVCLSSGLSEDHQFIAVNGAAI